MTTFADKLKTLPPHVQSAIADGHAISYSRASTFDECGLRGDFKYNKKYPDPPSEAMYHGIAFDSLSEGNLPDYKDVLPENQTIIKLRVAEYMNQVDKILTRYSQYPVYAEIRDGWWFYGWLDDMFCHASGKIASLDDRKFSGKPWPWKKDPEPILDANGDIIGWRGESDKVKRYHKQAQCYMWATRQMGLAIPPEFLFKVANLATSGIQIFPYKPQAKSLTGIPDWLWKNRGDINGLFPPQGGLHCKWCPYSPQGSGICDEYLNRKYFSPPLDK